MIFDNKEFGQIRTIEKEGEPWFVAADVCRALEIDRTQIRRLDEDEKGVYSTQTPGGAQKMIIVNEPGLYSLVLGSRKPETNAFKRWITHEVIPSIRKHGGYLTPKKIEEALLNPDVIIRLATELKSEREARIAAENDRDRLEAKTIEDAPKVLFAQSVEASETSILIGELAKLLKQNGVEIGQKRLFERLRKDGYLCRGGTQRNYPTQGAMELGVFEVVERAVNNPDGSIRLTRTTKVTGKGQIYFVNRYSQLKKEVI